MNSLPSKGHVSNRRGKILDEALKLTGRCGYRGLSIQSVAVRTGLTKQGVMHYFPTKDQLLVALLNERDASIEADLLQLLAAGGFDSTSDPEQKRKIFRDSLVAVVEHMLETPDLLKLHVALRAEAIHSDHPARAYFSRRDDGTLTWLAQRATFFCKRPLSMARQILATMVGLQAMWVQDEQRFDLLAEWRESLATMI